MVALVGGGGWCAACCPGMYLSVWVGLLAICVAASVAAAAASAASALQDILRVLIHSHPSTGVHQSAVSGGVA